jgi:hypothetical protein
MRIRANIWHLIGRLYQPATMLIDSNFKEKTFLYQSAIYKFYKQHPANQHVTWLFVTSRRTFLYYALCLYFPYLSLLASRSICTEYYMSKYVSHAVSTREPYITPGGPRGDIGFSGWYGMWYRFWHVMFIMSYISTMPLIIHVQCI